MRSLIPKAKMQPDASDEKKAVVPLIELNFSVKFYRYLLEKLQSENINEGHGQKRPLSKNCFDMMAAIDIPRV